MPTVIRPGDFALAAARRGWFVVPLCHPHLGRCACGRGHQGRSVGKAPLQAGWQSTRLTPDTLEQGGAGVGATPWGQSNVGILLAPSNLVVVDADSPEAVHEAQRNGVQGAGIVQRGERRHFYFGRPDGCPTARRIGCGVSGKLDILAAGFVVAPPSRHVEGGCYWWQELPDLLPEAPAWAVNALRLAAPVADAPSANPSVLRFPLSSAMQDLLINGPAQEIANGKYPSRSEALYALACSLIRSGYTNTETCALLLSTPWVIDMRDKHAPLRPYVEGVVRRAQRAVGNPVRIQIKVAR